MLDRIINSFEMYYPFLAKDAVDYKLDGKHGLIVKLNDGTYVMYHYEEQYIRTLPNDTNNMTENECKKEFGIRLRKLMILRGITQCELSEKTGIQQYLISNYITGKTSPSFYNVDKIAKALGCSTEEFRYV